MSITIQEQPWGHYDGKIVKEFTLVNAGGLKVSILTLGGTITRFYTPDRLGHPGNIVLGFESLKGYLQPGNPYCGALIGRFANRIAHARFNLDGRTYPLFPNDKGHCLHGGRKGFDKVIWDAEILEGEGLRLHYLSRDGEEGFPGNLDVTVVYRLTEDGLVTDYEATTDQATPINLTSHAYFNLSAGHDPTVLQHEVMIRADRFTEATSDLVPTGRLQPAAGGPMDFTTPKKIGQDIGYVSGGYDHNYVLGKGGGPVASVYHAPSGRCLDMFTTEPGVQFYTGNFLDGTLTGTYGGQLYGRHAGLCLEAQHFPDSPNQPSFPDTILRPGECYRQTTRYRCAVR